MLMVGIFQQKSITHYVSPEISVGFCQYGPILTIAGALSTKKNVLLINSMGLSLSIPFHSLKKEFEWFAFQSGSSTEASLGMNIDAPSKFVLSPDNAKKYNILFVDYQRYAEMKNILSNISAAWQGILENSEIKDLTLAFKDFKSQTITRGMIEMLEQMCYWKTGDYTLTVSISSKGEAFFTEKIFQLDEAQVALLKNNAPNILAGLCGQPAVIFNTIKIPLQDK